MFEERGRFLRNHSSPYTMQELSYLVSIWFRVVMTPIIVLGVERFSDLETPPMCEYVTGATILILH